MKHALTRSPIKKRNSASQCFPLINCDVAQDMLLCSCNHLQACDVRVCTAATRSNCPGSNYFVVESYSTGAKHTRIPGACYSSLHVRLRRQMILRRQADARLRLYQVLRYRYALFNCPSPPTRHQTSVNTIYLVRFASIWWVHRACVPYINRWYLAHDMFLL